MRSDDQPLASRLMIRDLGPTRVIEVDGELGLIGGHDLRRAFTAALHSTNGAVTLDLSSVTAIDHHGAAALEWCSTEAIAARRVLTWSACSQPLVRDLRERRATDAVSRLTLSNRPVHARHQSNDGHRVRPSQGS